MHSGLQKKLTFPPFLRQMKFGIKYIIFKKNTLFKKYIILELYSPTCFLASTYFRIFLLLCRAWHQSRSADHGRSDFCCKCSTEEGFSPDLSSTYSSFREEGVFYKVKRHEGHRMCQAALLKCRATYRQRRRVCQAEKLQMSWTHDAESSISSDGSVLPACSGQSLEKARCLLCSEGERKEERPPCDCHGCPLWHADGKHPCVRLCY